MNCTEASSYSGMQHSLDEGDTSVVVPHFCLLAAMQTLCALVSHDDAKQRWLQSTGILGLLQRLTVQDNLGSGAVPLPPHPVIPSLVENTPLRLWRESARIVAMISADAASQTMIRCTPCLTQMQASIAVVLVDIAEAHLGLLSKLLLSPTKSNRKDGLLYLL